VQPSVDALTSPTIKHLRERWWDDEFTAFLIETLRPRSGTRILDVGSGAGGAEVRLGRRQISQMTLHGVDLKIDEVIAAARAAASHNQRARFAAGDALCLPFASGVFDSTFCVAVLQHVADVDTAVCEFARVTRAGGRIVAVEPDNAARYAYASSPNGQEAFRLAADLFAAVSSARGDSTDPSIGVKIPGLFERYGIQPLDVRVFPVSYIQFGQLPDDVWTSRRRVAEELVADSDAAVKTRAQRYLSVLEAYKHDADAAGPGFVEIQNTMLFATVGEKPAA
jgi:SAM-dependent methyltransferase